MIGSFRDQQPTQLLAVGFQSERETMRITILIPEFPGQTHAFFWREIKTLQATGVSVQVLSTRHPLKAVDCHTWSAAAMAITTYAVPLTLSKLLCAVVTILLAGPARWYQCTRLLIEADGERLTGRLRLIGLFLIAGFFAHRLRKFGSKHLHAHSCADSAYLAAFASKLTGIPYSLTLHSAIGVFGAGQEAKWGNAAFGVAVSNSVLLEMRNRVLATRNKEIPVVSMGVDPEYFQREKDYEPPSKSDTLRIVTCGRLHPGKGHDDVIRAVGELRDKGYRLQLSLLGEGPDRRRLQTLVSEFMLEEVVRFRGAVSESVVRAQLQEAHMFVLASHQEAIGVATMEAMAMSLPVIVTEVGGVSELVRDQVDGLLVPPGDMSAIVQAITFLAETPTVAVAMGRSGALRVRSSFHSRLSAEMLTQLINAHVSVLACSFVLLSNRI